MPTLKRFDFMIGGKGFMLARSQYKGRAWLRMGRSDSPGERSQGDARWGVLPDELDHPEVWDDWSGGYGRAYRRGEENTYHWAENFDARFPRQLVHAQQFRTITTATLQGWYAASSNLAINGLSIMDAPLASWNAGTMMARRAAGKLLLRCAEREGILRPTGVEASPFELISYATTGSPPEYNPGYGRPALFGSFWHVPVSHASLNYWFGTIEDGLISTLAPVPGQGFAVVGNRLWRFSGRNQQMIYLQSIAAGSDLHDAGNWSATLNVGNGYNSILDMLDYEDQLMVGMADGLYAGDSTGTFVNVLNQLSSQVNPDNCRDLCIHNNRVIAPTVGGLFSYEAYDLNARVREILMNTGNKSPVQGWVRAVRPHGPWLYAGLYTGSTTYLLAGKDRGDGEYIWHTMQRTPHTVMPSRLYFDSISVASGGKEIPTRMWLLTDRAVDTTATSPVYWMPIPKMNNNPLVIDPVFAPNYCGSARIDLGSVDWGAPGTPKLYRAAEVWADNLASGAQWCQIYYTVDNEGTRRLLGTVAKSPKDTLYFPHAEGSFVTGQSIELSLESFTASAAITPIYRSIILRGALQPRSVDLITAKVRIADGVVDRTGAPMRSGATMLRELRALGNVDVSRAQAYQLVDLAGATAWVKVVGRIEEEEYYQTGEENPEIAATVRLAVLDYE